MNKRVFPFSIKLLTIIVDYVLLVCPHLLKLKQTKRNIYKYAIYANIGQKNCCVSLFVIYFFYFCYL